MAPVCLAALLNVIMVAILLPAFMKSAFTCHKSKQLVEFIFPRELWTYRILTLTQLLSRFQVL